ncbi:MAG TPA: hypothetical protein VE465_13155, partial [Streptosporangiaceae bacterium]|nr:hypothetical protein [Streptosporangiaceae bacterium]
MRKYRLVTVMVMGPMTAAGLLMSPSAAFAHDVSRSIHFCGPGDNNRCGYGGVTNSHTRAYACDTYSDGDGFRTVVRLQSGGTAFVDDANGSTSGCSAILPGVITGFRVISKQSAGWVYSPSPTGWH